MKRFKMIILLLISFTLGIFFQNCSKAKFTPALSESPSGDPISTPNGIPADINVMKVKFGDPYNCIRPDGWLPPFSSQYTRLFENAYSDSTCTTFSSFLEIYDPNMETNFQDQSGITSAIIGKTLNSGEVDLRLKTCQRVGSSNKYVKITHTEWEVWCTFQGK